VGVDHFTPVLGRSYSGWVAPPRSPTARLKAQINVHILVRWKGVGGGAWGGSDSWVVGLGSLFIRDVKCVACSLTGLENPFKSRNQLSVCTSMDGVRLGGGD
jgi:hypothetical protein